MHNNEDADYHVQDKVRIQAGEYEGQRGIIQAFSQDKLEIILNSGTTTQVTRDNVTNLSLAARKAWRTMRSRGDSKKSLESLFKD